jgi:hypothetical protein
MMLGAVTSARCNDNKAWHRTFRGTGLHMDKDKVEALHLIWTNVSDALPTPDLSYWKT